MIENFFCWDANLPAPGAKKPKSRFDQAKEHEAELDSLRRGHGSDKDVDKPHARLIEVVEYPCKDGEGDKAEDGKVAKGSAKSRYFVEKSDAKDYDAFTEIECQKDKSGIWHLSLKACIILVCKNSGKQWEVNLLG